MTQGIAIDVCGGDSDPDEMESRPAARFDSSVGNANAGLAFPRLPAGNSYRFG